MDQIFYYQGKAECDFVVQRGVDVTQLIQVSWSINDDATRQREITGLLEAAQVTGCKNLLIVTADTSEEIKIDETTTINVVPAWRWLL
jgi:predicted AAA+ superfamily ATPase